jgi:hypothetical protein
MVRKLLFSRSKTVSPFLRVIVCATSGCIASPNAALADYRYISEDPIITHERLISDLGSGQLDRPRISCCTSTRRALYSNAAPTDRLRAFTTGVHAIRIKVENAAHNSIAYNSYSGVW